MITSNKTMIQSKRNRLTDRLQREIIEKRQLKLERDKLRNNLEAAEELIQRLLWQAKQRETKDLGFMKNSTIATKTSEEMSCLLQRFEAEKCWQFHEIMNFHQKEIQEIRLRFERERLIFVQGIAGLKAELSQANLRERLIKNQFSRIEKEKRQLENEIQIMRTDIDLLMKLKVEPSTSVSNQKLQTLEAKVAATNNDFQKMKREYNKVKQARDDFRESLLTIAQSVHNLALNRQNQLSEQLSRIENILEE